MDKAVAAKVWKKDELKYIRSFIEKSNKINRHAKYPPRMRRTLFLLKGNTLKHKQYRSIIKFILSYGFRITQLFWTVLGNKEKFFKKFYSHVSPEIIEREANVNFSNICLAIITNDNRIREHQVVVKRLIRYKHGTESIHASDNWVRANQEIAMVKDTTKMNWNGISDAFVARWKYKEHQRKKMGGN